MSNDRNKGRGKPKKQERARRRIEQALRKHAKAKEKLTEALRHVALDRLGKSPEYQALLDKQQQLRNQRHRDRLNVNRYPKSIKTHEQALATKRRLLKDTHERLETSTMQIDDLDNQMNILIDQEVEKISLDEFRGGDSHKT